MKRRLEAVYWQGILITLLMAAISIGAAARVKISDTRNQLTALLKAAARWTLDSNEELQSLADSISAVTPGLRVTFLHESGLILADSMEAYENDGGHYGDPEIAAAREGGTGRDIRMSSSEAALILYMAEKVSPQLILRLSYPVLEIARTLILYGIALLALFLVLYWAERRAVSRLIRDQQKQLEDIRDLLDGEQGNRQAVFPEFQPVYDSISYRISRLINDRMEIERTLNLRKDFVANASHELRSPLTSVRGFAEMLEEDLAETPKERKICLETIISECDRMLEVIEDILLLSKSAKKTEENIRKISAAETAEEVRHAIRPQAAKKNISIEISGNTVIRAEEKDIWEVFYNLMDNAVRYGKNGGFVRVVMSDGEISVEDDGIGIAPENLKSVFDEFYRVDEAKNEVPGGTGLGLSIVKTIVEKLGGTIRAESEYGKGSRFIIEFQEKTDDEEIR